MVKRIAGAILGCVLAAILFIPSTALVAPIDGLLRLSTLGGAEKENSFGLDHTAGGGHALFNGEALMVIPTFFLPPLGVQLTGDIVAANAGWRGGFNGGPIFDFGMGKAGVLFVYQFRHYQGKCGNSDIDLNAAWVRPAVSFYLPQTNINAWVSQGLSPRHTANACEGDRRKVFVPVNEFHIEANYFPAVALFGRDNLELSLGVTAQNLWGLSRSTGNGIGPVSVGPSAGVAFMPWQNLEVTLARGWFDVNHNKYKVLSGIQYYFNFAKNPNLSLLQNRRQYLEPTLEPGTMATFWNRL